MIVDAPLLSEYHDDPEMQPLLQEFVARLASNCQLLRQAIENRNLDVIRCLAHQYKGSGTGHGYPAISEWGGRLEDAVRQASAVDATVRSAAEMFLATCECAEAGLR